MIVIPVRVPLTQTPLFNPWQDWALGILHMKITCALALMGPNWWLKVSNDVLVDLALALSLSISISISRSHSFLGIYRRLSLPSSHISLCLRLSLSVCLSLSLSLLLLPLPVSRAIIIPPFSPVLAQASLERIYQEGLWNLHLRSLLFDLAFPVLGVLGLVIAAPYVVAHSLVPRLGED